MSLELAVRLAEMVFAFAYFLQSVEFTRGLYPEKTIAFIRINFCFLLFINIQPVIMESGLLVLALFLLHRFQGPYNGGSDRMSILVLLCLWISHIAPNRFWQEIALSYLAFQLMLSYFQAGYIKIINPEWRNGQALRDVFAMTAYPVSTQVRQWSQSPRLMLLMSWAVILFELVFPFSLLNHITLITALSIALIFHLANACLFGLNRFFWVWPAAYPILIWFQMRVITV